jgi:hypothetical protein
VLLRFQVLLLAALDTCLRSARNKVMLEHATACRSVIVILAVDQNLKLDPLS